MEKPNTVFNMESGDTHKITWTFPFCKCSCTSASWKITSEPFWFLGKKWEIVLQTVHQGGQYKMSTFLNKVDGENKVVFKCFIYGLDNDTSEIYDLISSTHNDYLERHYISVQDDWNTFLNNTLKSQSGNLTLYCQLIPMQTSKPKQPVRCLSKQMSMLTDQKYTDVVIMAGGKQFKAHKVILAAHSPVFDTMLSSNMKESIENAIKIDDFDEEVVQEILTYIYSDCSPKMEKLAFKLLLAAEKYDIDRLKALCEQNLIANLSVDTVVKCQALALLCNANQLKVKAAQFIADNMAEVQETDDWKNVFVKGFFSGTQEEMQLTEQDDE